MRSPVDEIAGRHPSSPVMTAVQLWCRVTVVDADGTELGGCVLQGPGRPDLGAVDVVAHLTLLAGRRGGAVVLADVSPALRDLLEMAGLGVGVEGLGVEVEGLGLEVEGQAEPGKEPLGVEGMEEETHLGDLPS